MPYYFAYGSCMNVKDLHRTDKRAVKVSTGILHDYRLAYTWYSSGRRGGVADVIKSPGDRVEGIIYEVPDFTLLDAREGHPYIYRRFVLKGGRKRAPIHSYAIVKKSSIEYVPSPEYFRLIQTGALSLSPSYQEELQEHYSQLRRQVLAKPRHMREWYEEDDAFYPENPGGNWACRS